MPVSEDIVVEDAGSAEPRSWNACAQTTADLTTSPVFDHADPRLLGDAVIIIFKGQRRIGMYSGGNLAELNGKSACWPMALAPMYPAGPKRRQGDRKTPEGWYRTSDKPWSNYYGAIAVHYPNELDAAVGLADGTLSKRQHDAIVSATSRGEKPPQTTGMGGEILIHGGGSGSDWTLGCVAMDNPKIDLLRANLPGGIVTDVLILP